ncbi:hypothetical protein Dsin_021707 [Dipteronia sinensis]|uniref:Uncharacterized protein n=1 Tax=Dipteronia sinensis TaxID=43782 RepID=A0AAE0A166_9ROSI|nr:hypothetical protein Dsin_021707 [Dipteronia sinensis]
MAIGVHRGEKDRHPARRLALAVRVVHVLLYSGNDDVGNVPFLVATKCSRQRRRVYGGVWSAIPETLA